MRPDNTTCTMRGWLTSLMAVCIGLTVIATTAYGGLTDRYQLAKYSGSANDMSGSTTIFGSYYSNTSSSLRNIGFDFYFDAKKYTTFSVTPSGLLALGTRPYSTYYPYYWPNSSNMSSSYPAIAGYWGRYFYTSSSGKVHTKLSGTAPNRVLTIEWRNVGRFGSTSTNGGTWQVRLYETSNQIEFYYDWLRYPSSSSTSYSASIGIAAGSTRYINVVGNGFPNSDVAEYPSGRYYNYYRLYYDPINSNTVYSFNPCVRELSVEGNTDDGGTDEMEDGDVLLNDLQTMRGNTDLFHPFSLMNPGNGCFDVEYRISISGEAAGDYSFPTSGTIGIGETFVPDIVFTPQTVGERSATITITLDNGQEFQYVLNATGLTRIDWISNDEEGGTGALADGDELLTNINVNRGDSHDLQPFRLHNFNLDPESSSAEISYVLDDPLGQYSIRLQAEDEIGSGSLVENIAGGESSELIITFAPNKEGSEYGTGHQPATLTVIADNEQRVFTLNGFSVAPAMDFYYSDGSRLLESDGTLFRGIESCVGDEVTSVEFNIENTNLVDVTIEEFLVYEVDSRIQQGTQRYPLDQNQFGQLVRLNDYFISEGAGVVPQEANMLPDFPLTLQPGERRTFHLNYIAHRPGKRYARLFMRTDAVNFYGEETANFRPTMEDQEPTAGMLNLSFFARGLGAELSKNLDGVVNGLSLTFDPVKVGQSGEGEVEMFNTGVCDLRVKEGDFRLVTGDVGDFELIEVLKDAATDADGNFIIPAGGSAMVKARFTPSRSGSRRASILVRTNDSTIYADGVAERGIYYLNLYGVGKADLRVRDLALSPAVIDGPGSTGVLPVRNTSTEVIEITNLALIGPNTDQIMEDPANPWPTLPVQVLPEEALELGLAFEAASGSTPGVRTATLEITYGSGETISSTLIGEAGTRTLVTAPTSLFDGVTIPAGELMRQIAVVSNSGTFPVEITEIAIEGAGVGDYRYHSSGRLRLDPGASEFVEITYAPSEAGPSEATLVLRSNATNGDQTVSLGAVATGTTVGGDPQGSATRARGEAASRSVSGMELSLTSRPNPAISTSEIRYALPAEGDVNLSIYDSKGSFVRSLVDGVRSAGQYSEKVNVENLPSGTYVYVLRQGGEVVTRSMTIVN